MRIVREMSLAALLLAAAACADADAGGGDAKPSATAGRWHVDPVPVVEIGVLEGPAHYQFTYPMAVLRMTDGRIVVAEGSDNALRFYDASGGFIQAVGGDGEGPGEFRRIGGAWRFGDDSIVVSDPDLGRISVLSPSGEFARSYLLDVVPGFAPEVLDVFRDDGALIVQPLQAGEVLHLTQGPRRDTLPISIVSPDGVLERVVGDFLGNEMFGGGASYGQRAFGAKALVAAGRDAFHYASGDSFHIQRWDRIGGGPADVVRIAHTPRPVSASAQQAWRDAKIAGASGRFRQFTVEFAEKMTFPETMPALDDLIVDRAGNLWARSYAPEDSPENHWTVFDASGLRLAEIDLPSGFDPRDVGPDWLLGVVRDETGIPRIRMYRLDRNGGTEP